ncbi:histidine kinase dimerization/phospho-acceptor domain-containing protein [uncultured Robinsoniella sp.]|uniref:sensor histidine kinase n=1 Tax=uncultured Robinsoniella sp. TaxID=904190 RepID=UPI00374F3E98
MMNNEQELKCKGTEFRAARKIITMTVEYMSLIIIICSFMISLSMMTSLEDFQNAFGKPYPATAKYEAQVEEKIGQLHEFLEGSNKFETDGFYDPDRIVDIEDYAQHKNISGTSKGGLTYRLHDLLQWAQQGLELNMEEAYSPIGYKDIGEYASKTGKDRDKLYLQLKIAIAGIWEDVWHYNTLKVEFNGKNTNLKYIVEDKNNKKICGNTQLSEEQILNLGTYVVLDYKNLEYDANLKFKKNIYSNLGRGISPNCIDSRIVIGVDTSFPVQDEFYNMKERYENWMPWSRAAAVVCGIFMFIWLSSIGYYTYISGYDKEEFGMMKIDRFPIEMLTLISVMVIVFGVHLAHLSYQNLGIFPGIAGVLFSLAGFANGMFVVWYGSMVRRVKGGVLLKYSFIWNMWQELYRMIYKRKVAVRILVWYIACLSVIMLGIISITVLGVWGLPLTIIVALLIGLNLVKMTVQQDEISTGMEYILKGDFDYKIDASKFLPSNRRLADSVNKMSKSLESIIEENTKNERQKTDLITNVSHDIKTPLTSIINYVDLLKRLDLSDQKAKDYLEVLDQKSQRLKYLTEDLLEASRISSGNILLEYININFKELILQTAGEFSDQFKERGLELITSVPDHPIIIRADNARIWRVIENLYNNIVKYAMPGTRVYAAIRTENGKMVFSIKNISEYLLNMEAEELTERFIQGDKSRSTEGSGLGLSIARSLTEMQGGEFRISVDGDLFKAVLIFPIAESGIDGK